MLPYSVGLTLSTYFLNYFYSELFYRVGIFIKIVSFVETQKNVIYSKLLNNPFKSTLNDTIIFLNEVLIERLIFISIRCVLYRAPYSLSTSNKLFYEYVPVKV